MAYPWSGFASIVFTATEQPILGTDTGWKRKPVRDRNPNLGSAIDSIVTLAIGSAERSWEAHFEPERLAALEALMGSTDTLTDWISPQPDSRAAYLELVDPGQSVAMICTDGSTRRKIRAKLMFVSQ